MTTDIKSKTRAAAKSVKTTKKALLIALLGRKAGTTVIEVSEKFDWQQHTTRAALTGLRKAGYEIESRKPKRGGPSSYHIVGQTPEPDGVTV